MAIAYSTAIRTSRAEVVRAAINYATPAGKLLLYSGVRPTTGAAISTQTLLATLAFSADCGSVTNGVLAFSAIAAGTAVAGDGTVACTWARITDGDNAFVADLDVGPTGSGKDIILNNVNIVLGGEVSISSSPTPQITEGNA